MDPAAERIDTLSNSIESTMGDGDVGTEASSDGFIHPETSHLGHHASHSSSMADTGGMTTEGEDMNDMFMGDASFDTVHPADQRRKGRSSKRFVVHKRTPWSHWLLWFPSKVVLRTLTAGVSVVVLLIWAIILYAIFYYHFIPPYGHVYPIYLQYEYVNTYSSNGKLMSDLQP